MYTYVTFDGPLQRMKRKCAHMLPNYKTLAYIAIHFAIHQRYARRMNIQNETFEMTIREAAGYRVMSAEGPQGRIRDAAEDAARVPREARSGSPVVAFGTFRHFLFPPMGSGTTAHLRGQRARTQQASTNKPEESCGTFTLVASTRVVSYTEAR